MFFFFVWSIETSGKKTYTPKKKKQTIKPKTKNGKEITFDMKSSLTRVFVFFFIIIIIFFCLENVNYVFGVDAIRIR